MKEIKFEDDLKNIIKKFAKTIGFKIADHNDVRKMLLNYLTVRLKLISTKGKQILVNPHFCSTIYNHPKKAEIEEIISIAKGGGNMNIYQSKKSFQSNFHDHLQNEWRIWHFHLSQKTTLFNGFVRQTNMLLFAYIDLQHVIFLGTDTHKQGIFAENKWPEILHDNFPNVIAGYKARDIMELEPIEDGAQLQDVWDSGVSGGLTHIRDTIYVNPGAGRTTSGHGIQVALERNNIINWLTKNTVQLEGHWTELCKTININTLNLS